MRLPRFLRRRYPVIAPHRYAHHLLDFPPPVDLDDYLAGHTYPTDMRADPAPSPPVEEAVQ